MWVLDSLPGEVRADGGPLGGDHPGQLIDFLRTITMPVVSRNEVIDLVMRGGELMGRRGWLGGYGSREGMDIAKPLLLTLLLIHDVWRCTA